MAWTDQCKIQAVDTINKIAEDRKLSATKAIKALSEESDIPASTLNRWFYPSKSYPKTGVTSPPKKAKNAKPEPASWDCEPAEARNIQHLFEQWKEGIDLLSVAVSMYANANITNITTVAVGNCLIRSLKDGIEKIEAVTAAKVAVNNSQKDIK